MLIFMVVPVRLKLSMRALSGAGSAARPTISRNRNGSALTITARAVSSRPSLSTTPVATPLVVTICCTPELVSISAPCARAVCANALAIAPMPPLATIHVPSDPGNRHMLCTRKFIPVPGVPNDPASPEKPSVTAYIAMSISL